MILADKIIRLRKKNGWSQEELAVKMSVSRQAVSKWEGAQTVPDLQKILQLSELFGVTTDYLLKDEFENEEFTSCDTDTAIKRVTLAQANEYLEHRKTSSKRIALATVLCIVSVIPLLLLCGAVNLGLSENLAAGVGLILIVLIVAAAVAIYISCGFKNTPYEFLDDEPFDTEYGVIGMVNERQKKYRNTYAKGNIGAACICVLSPVPLFVGAFSENEFFIVVMLCVTMLIISAAVAIFITVGVQWASMQRLLKSGEFSADKKTKNTVISTVVRVYWLFVTAVYLGVSFITENWETSWIVWPVAGVLCGAVIGICNMLFLRDKGDD